ncbi:hypothetical protein GCM10011414_11010 [Croceivirga lutea]|uniref:hypothetical protein n=1 Tax=Croceivirga lutea TaxID=1775167 RepID=UPI001639BB8B|nr:hypothetical protein [Croceivirga lutea]GGG43173.1 hypothetical protein GCM10011414_11010 [Croceivirga lutea]
MEHFQKVGIELYQNLGKLFFAVAMADGTVHKKELEKLRLIVRDNWLDVDDIEDRYHSDAAYQIETVFDWAMEYDMSSAQGFEFFKEFYKDHPKLFPVHIKNLILYTADAIANSFSKTNKSELVLLGNIKILFRD